jgi:hypothetical protein
MLKNWRSFGTSGVEADGGEIKRAVYCTAGHSREPGQVHLCILVTNQKLNFEFNDLLFRKLLTH